MVTIAKMEYIVVKAINENSISFAVTDGETASSVFINPNTTQGCLPISVKSHPEVFAINGKNIASGINFKYFDCFSNIPFLEVKMPKKPSRSMIPPVAVIIRNTQNNKVTFGI